MFKRCLILVVSIVMVLSCLVSCDKAESSKKETEEKTLEKGIEIEAKENVPAISVNGVNVLKLYDIETKDITYDWCYIDGEYSGKDQSNKLFIYINRPEDYRLMVWIKAVEYLKTKADYGIVWDYSSFAPGETTLVAWEAANFTEELQDILVRISVNNHYYDIEGSTDRIFLDEYNDYKLAYVFKVIPTYDVIWLNNNGINVSYYERL